MSAPSTAVGCVLALFERERERSLKLSSLHRRTFESARGVQNHLRRDGAYKSRQTHAPLLGWPLPAHGVRADTSQEGTAGHLPKLHAFAAFGGTAAAMPRPAACIAAGLGGGLRLL